MTLDSILSSWNGKVINYDNEVLNIREIYNYTAQDFILGDKGDKR